MSDGSMPSVSSSVPPVLSSSLSGISSDTVPFGDQRALRSIAEALLAICSHTGTSLSDELTTTLRSFADTIAQPPIAAPISESPAPNGSSAEGRRPNPLTECATSAVKPKGSKKVKIADAPVVSTTGTGTEYPNDPYMNHPLRLNHAKILRNKCMGRICTNSKDDHLVPGTLTSDPGSNGRMFVEYQCRKDPESGSALCETCASRDTKYNAQTKKKQIAEWYGRLDEPLCDFSKVIGSGHFFKKYPNGLANDPLTAPVTPVVAAVPETLTAVPVVAEEEAPAKKVRVKKPKVAAETAILPPPTPKGSSAEGRRPKPEVLAANVAPKETQWISFNYAERMHIRNVMTGKTYLADMTKATPNEMAVKEHYVGVWLGAGEVDLTAEYESDSE